MTWTGVVKLLTRLASFCPTKVDRRLVPEAELQEPEVLHHGGR